MAVVDILVLTEKSTIMRVLPINQYYFQTISFSCTLKLVEEFENQQKTQLL